MPRGLDGREFEFTVSDAFFSQMQRPYHRHLLQQASHLLHLGRTYVVGLARWRF
jgi:hypothetical protein